MISSTYVIYAPSFNPNNGGSIVQHQLCHHLNQLGQRAVLHPMQPFYKIGRRARLAGLFKKPKFHLAPDLNTPMAKRSDLVDTSIVVYAELIAGNPLKAKNVVRWLLHRPGFHTGVVDYGEEDLFFKFDDESEDASVTGGNTPQLFLFTLNPCYQMKNKSKRTGICYLIRKGKSKRLVHDMEGAIQIDGLPHEEIAAIFNRCETFYSYDEATMYSQFAAICGCTSIVIPQDNIRTREDWTAKHPMAKFGTAYGLHDLEHAQKTKHLVFDYLKLLEQEGLETVQNFVKLTQQHFVSNTINAVAK